jgi:hypothetical protein
LGIRSMNSIRRRRILLIVEQKNIFVHISLVYPFRPDSSHHGGQMLK